MPGSGSEYGPHAKIQALPTPAQSEREDSGLEGAEPDHALVKAQAEAELAKIKGVTHGLKEIFETPGWATLLQGAGQWLTLGAENTKALNQQDHERQKLKLVQEHERAMQLDRLNMEAEQRRSVLGVITLFGLTLVAVAVVVAGITAIKWGWIDEKTAAIAWIAIGGVAAQTRRWMNSKSGSSATPPA